MSPHIVITYTDGETETLDISEDDGTIATEAVEEVEALLQRQNPPAFVRLWDGWRMHYVRAAGVRRIEMHP